MIRTRRQLPLWASALLLVLAGHMVLAAMLLGWQKTSPVAEPAAATLLIELPPQPALTAPAAVPAEPVTQKPVPASKPVAPALKPKPAPVKTARPKPARAVVKAPAPREEPSPAAAFVPPATASASPARSEVSASTPNRAGVTWQNRLLSHLTRFKRYPDDARRRGTQGQNALRLVIDSAGRVEVFALAASSGSAALDRATLQLIRRAQPLPAPPAELLERGLVEVIAPVSYTLDKR